MGDTGEEEVKNIEKQYDNVIDPIKKWPQCGEHSQLPKETVYSWAFCGYTLKPKPPCIRCTYLYSSWKFEGRRITVEEKRQVVRELRGHQMIYHENKNPPCGYCAETVAAAQLFALGGPMVYSG